MHCECNVCCPCSLPGLEPGPLYQETSALTLRSTRLLCSVKKDMEKLSNDVTHKEFGCLLGYLRLTHSLSSRGFPSRISRPDGE